MNLLEWLFGAPAIKKKRVFISFSMKDRQYRDYLVQQAKLERSPFEFMDMSVKKPWKQHEWQEKCRRKIASCDGVIVLLSKNTYHASGVRWEMKCARALRVPMVGMHIQKGDRGATPPELSGKQTITWNWKDLKKVISRF